MVIDVTKARELSCTACEEKYKDFLEKISELIEKSASSGLYTVTIELSDGEDRRAITRILISCLYGVVLTEKTLTVNW